MTFSETTPLGEARQWLRERAQDGGARCPCCTQRAQVYRRSIGSAMARDLIKCYRAVGVGQLFYLPEVVGYGGDAAKLAYWGLLAEDPRPREDGGRAGWWTVTQTGERFALGQITVQKYALVYDGRLLRLDGEPVAIVACLGKRFNLRALLDGGE